MTSPIDLNLITHEDFKRVLEQTFVVGDTGIECTLMNVSLRSPHPDLTRTPFSLTFASNSKTILPQGTYHLFNPALPALAIFIVPIREEKNGIVYQAVFN
ncbi:hypothetical protein QCD60_22845 [Pokkaliibacter sp. MBI-7]|uniref:DUF6916 family protein n=1 Tax=Pokkaliibacter sp. MBI-7 TaxID=3040600 RepID=UPI00244B730C|nr:hypothetical protein [Pokkaliibacter sp. MBI-7]MDH2435366.1 hypothetical protein [Pokkaliibacter sp. MBI-7]